MLEIYDPKLDAFSSLNYRTDNNTQDLLHIKRDILLAQCQRSRVKLQMYFPTHWKLGDYRYRIKEMRESNKLMKREEQSLPFSGNG